MVGAAPVSGPPIAVGLNVKLATARPGGVAPGSDTLAAAHTISIGHASPTSVSDSTTGSSNGRSFATTLPSSFTRRSANADASRRR